MRGNQDVHRIGVHFYNILKWSQAREGKQHLWENQEACHKIDRSKENQSKKSIKQVSIIQHQL